MPDKIRLKWGTIKYLDIDVSNKAAWEALDRYNEDPCQISVAAQHDTQKQKQAICDLIDALNCEPFIDWSGQHVSKEEAKKYVMEYGN